MSPTTKSQAHLQAISTRPALGEAVTDVLVRRGDREVVRCVADNRGARISQNSFSSLVKRAEDDGVLAEKVGLRPDIPAPMFRELLTKATAVVHERLLASATARRQGGDLPRAGQGLQGGRRARRSARLSAPRSASCSASISAGRMNEAALAAFCSDKKYEEAVVALATLAKVPVNVADRLMGGERPDPVLILCKAVGLSWPTVKAIIMLRPMAKARRPGARCRLRQL